jgi:hypothetical protein
VVKQIVTWYWHGAGHEIIVLDNGFWSDIQACFGGVDEPYPRQFFNPCLATHDWEWHETLADVRYG